MKFNVFFEYVRIIKLAQNIKKEVCVKYNKIKMEGVMKRKILSYVLAVALVMSSFTSFAFSVNISEKASEVGSGYGSSGKLVAPKSIKFTPKEDSFIGKEAERIVGRISQVFNYVAGIITTTVDANRAITVFDEGRVRATYGYNPGNGSYSLTGFSLFGGNKDLIKISEAGGIENFLMSMGASESMLKTRKLEYDADGNVVTGQNDTNEMEGDVNNLDALYTKVSWLGAVMDSLKKGVNQSASINFVEAGGASVTLYENGRPQVTLSAQSDAAGNPLVLSSFIYNDAGFLVAKSDLAYEQIEGPDGITENKRTNETVSPGEVALAAQHDGTATFKPTHNITYFDPYGRESYTTNSAGDVLSRVTYSSNGSRNYVHDLVNETKTYFEAGRPSFSTNEQGYTTAKWNYNQNGTLDHTVNYYNGVATSKTIFDYGKALGTVSLANGAGEGYSAADIRQAYYDIATAGDEQTMKNLYEKYNFTSYSLMAEFLTNDTLITFLGLNAEVEMKKMEEAEKEAKAEEEKQKANADKIWSALSPADQAALGEWNAEYELSEQKKADDRKKEEEKKKEDKSDDKDKKKDDALTEAAKALSPEAQIYAEARTKQSQAREKAWQNRVAARQKVGDDIKRAMWTMTYCNNGYSAVANVAVSINNAIERELGETSVSTSESVVDRETSTSSERLRPGWRRDTTTTDTTIRTTTTSRTPVKVFDRKTLSFSITVNDRGQAAFTMEGAKHTLKNDLIKEDVIETSRSTDRVETTSSSRDVDPIVTGENKGFVGADGGPIKGVQIEGIENMTPEEAAAAISEKIAGMSNAEIEALIAANGGQIFLQMGADTINVMDGVGFQPAAGETLYVGVSDVDAVKQIAANFGQQIMTMGDVTASRVNGKMTMTMNTSYGGGFVTGDKAIAKTMQTVNEVTKLAIENPNAAVDSDNQWIAQNVAANSWLQGTGWNYAQSWQALEMASQGGIPSAIARGAASGAKVKEKLRDFVLGIF